MMDEPAIRMWAWGQTPRNVPDRSSTVATHKQRTDQEMYQAADRLAAWVMDGQIRPEPAV